MIRCFWNFAKSFVRVQWAKMRGYDVLAHPVLARQRYDECVLCPFFDGVQCEKCCCLIEAKTVIAVEKCPAKRWRAVWIKKKDH